MTQEHKITVQELINELEACKDKEAKVLIYQNDIEDAFEIKGIDHGVNFFINGTEEFPEIIYTEIAPVNINDINPNEADELITTVKAVDNHLKQS